MPVFVIIFWVAVVIGGLVLLSWILGLVREIRKGQVYGYLLETAPEKVPAGKIFPAAPVLLGISAIAIIIVLCRMIFWPMIVAWWGS